MRNGSDSCCRPGSPSPCPAASARSAAAAWAAAQTEPDAAQLVLVGPAWRRLVCVFAEELVVGEQDLSLPAVVDEIDAVIPAVQSLLASPATAPGARG